MYLKILKHKTNLNIYLQRVVAWILVCSLIIEYVVCVLLPSAPFWGGFWVTCASECSIIFLQFCPDFALTGRMGQEYAGSMFDGKRTGK
jgi:hypothetical protein